MTRTVDPIVNRVIAKIEARHKEGMQTYGQTLASNTGRGVVGWISEAQEELMDALLYLEKVKQLLVIGSEQDAD